jgi:hypothetical protein
VPSGKKTRQNRAANTPRGPGAPPPRRPQQRSWRDRPLLIGGGLVAVVVVIVAVVAIVLTTGGGTSKAASPDFSQMVNLQTGPPPWNADNGDLQDHLPDVGLDALSQEALAYHIHSHLDMWVNGKKVTVPAQVGITQTFITEVHTHDTTGVIHVESPVTKDYVLGQFFGEWGVKLSPSCVGSVCGKLQYWVDGTKQTGNPADIVLTSHKEIAIVLGKKPAKIPGSYDFPAGE